MKREPQAPASAEHNSRVLRAAVKAIYAELEQLRVQRTCTGIADCCHFRLTGRTPYLTRGEAIVAAHAWRAAGRTSLPASGAEGACPMLVNQRCAIYADRPFGCRTHFCDAAGGPLARDQVRHWIHRLESLDTQLGGSGGVNLPAAIQNALQDLGNKSRQPKTGKSGKKSAHK